MILRRGDRGEAVERLQERLEGVGFPPGAIDGRFGPATEAAVLAFQAGYGLVRDGVVGRRTLDALDLAESIEPEPPYDLGDVTSEHVAEIVRWAPIGNIQRHLPAVLAGLAAEDLADREMVAMALATIQVETGAFAPVDERLSRFNTSPGGHPFDLYDHRDDLGNRGRHGIEGDGARYKGRGFIQLTGRSNYVRLGERLGVPLETEPELANDPEVAARLLAAFLAEKRVAILTALLADRLGEARRLVNGGLHGIDDFRETYRRALDHLPGAESEDDDGS